MGTFMGIVVSRMVVVFGYVNDTWAIYFVIDIDVHIISWGHCLLTQWLHPTIATK